MNNEKNDTFSLACEVVKILKEHGWHITFAESCTGGLACAELVGVPDASWVLDASFVTYANEAKINYLGVPESLIRDHGVVSEQVAGEMARGAALANSAEVGVGISGIAGPSGGSAEKPVGCAETVIFLSPLSILPALPKARRGSPLADRSASICQSP